MIKILALVKNLVLVTLLCASTLGQAQTYPSRPVRLVVGFARHERGAVGISTRGRDTGDAQIFIDLTDLPRLNHEYTVFARVVSGLDVVDGILEADVIQRVTVVK